MLNRILNAGIKGTSGTRNFPLGEFCLWAQITKRPTNITAFGKNICDRSNDDCNFTKLLKIRKKTYLQRIAKCNSPQLDNHFLWTKLLFQVLLSEKYWEQRRLSCKRLNKRLWCVWYRIHLVCLPTRRIVAWIFQHPHIATAQYKQFII